MANPVRCHAGGQRSDDYVRIHERCVVKHTLGMSGEEEPCVVIRLSSRVGGLLAGRCVQTCGVLVLSSKSPTRPERRLVMMLRQRTWTQTSRK